ncbi:MAG: LysM peptidoglycan-binding domain-containing protein [Anaerolineae bacterium]|nr:LysM peptidoglycan-binding domain-containing protein [Thermoflexales bacterium]MDW8408998.1 LysM peptidoglycan-binding domain-containing protein [Anaerolineae bacterium]
MRPRCSLLCRRAISRLVLLVLAFISTACGGSVMDVTPTVSPTLPLPTARPTLTPPATATLAPATLPPLREATPSPTPVTYVVQQGDTPILIANKFGVSVADLITLNNIDPAALQIGQTLIIPIGPVVSAPQSSALLPSPTPMPFEIRGLNVYRTPMGSLEVVGEVYNPGPSAIGNVQLEVSLLDEGGRTLLTVPFFVAQEMVRPNATSPFRVLFTDPPAAYSRYTIVPLRSEVIDPTTRYVNMTVARSEGVPSGSQFRVFGEVVNSDAVNAGQVLLVVTTYDPDGRVIGYRQVVLSEGPVTPNQVLPFDVLLASSSPTVARYVVTVQALRAQ